MTYKGNTLSMFPMLVLLSLRNSRFAKWSDRQTDPVNTILFESRKKMGSRKRRKEGKKKEKSRRFNIGRSL